MNAKLLVCTKLIMTFPIPFLDRVNLSKDPAHLQTIMKSIENNKKTMMKEKQEVKISNN